MAGEKLLTEMHCKGAKAAGKVFYLNDGGGLRLRIRPNGSKHWIFRYRLNAKEKNTSLGPYPQISLKQARDKAVEARALVIDGRDPILVRQVTRAQQAVAAESTFGSVARDWLEHNRPQWSIHHYKRNEGLIRRYLLPTMGHLPIDAIGEQVLFVALKGAYDRGVAESARRARAVAAQVFSFGRATHKCERNPARDMADNPYFKKPQVRHFSAIAQHDVPSLIQDLNLTGDQQKLSSEVVCALKMALYTGLRDYSIRAARWGEVDFDRLVWTVPASRMKSRREHEVPLPTQAVTALRLLEPLTFDGPSSYIFASASKHGHLAENTLRKALHRLGYKVTVHGMRSLITDVLNERGFRSDLIERQLDHLERSSVRAAYLRTSFLEQRREAMQWFADWCDGSFGGLESGNVVPFRETG